MKTNQLFDKVFKRALRLSSRPVVSFINGLFDKDLPLDSKITYHATEEIKDNLDKIMSDSIIAINNKEKFIIESQISDDNTMVVRVFDYSFFDAVKYKDIEKNKITLKFANPRVIYLEHTNSTPDELILEIIFEHQESFTFKVPTIKFLDNDIKDLNNKNMVILMPLYLLKLRNEIKKEQNIENAKRLEHLINNEIIKSIELNKELENITPEDARTLIVLLNIIYSELYGDIDLFKKEGVAKMLEEKLVLATDVAQEKGKREGKLEGKLEGKREGKREGKLEGKIEEKKEITERLLKMKMPIDDIVEITKLPIEEIEKLKSELE